MERFRCFSTQSTRNSAANSFDGSFACNNNAIINDTIIIVSFLLCLLLVVVLGVVKFI